VLKNENKELNKTVVELTTNVNELNKQVGLNKTEIIHKKLDIKSKIKTIADLNLELLKKKY
jgi:hypothetical protein